MNLTVAMPVLGLAACCGQDRRLVRVVGLYSGDAEAPPRMLRPEHELEQNLMGRISGPDPLSSVGRTGSSGMGGNSINGDENGRGDKSTAGGGIKGKTGTISHIKGTGKSTTHGATSKLNYFESGHKETDLKGSEILNKMHYIKGHFRCLDRIKNATIKKSKSYGVVPKSKKRGRESSSGHDSTVS